MLFFYLKFDVILNKALEYIIKVPCLCSTNVTHNISMVRVEIMAEKYMLIKDILEEITFMKQLFIFIILIRISLKINDMTFLLQLILQLLTATVFSVDGFTNSCLTLKKSSLQFHSGMRNRLILDSTVDRTSLNDFSSLKLSVDSGPPRDIGGSGDWSRVTPRFHLRRPLIRRI